jgi:pimeloyl-ACP methyl ester carboxylesterase
MTAAEARAAGVLAGRAGCEIVDTVQGVHRAVAARTPAPPLYDLLSDLVYAGVRGGFATAGHLGGWAAAAARRGRSDALADSRAGGFVLSSLGGFVGDRLEERGDPLTQVMGLRHDGRTLAPGAHPHATGRLVVFVHGLSETERAWWFVPRGEAAAPAYGERLAELGWTDLYVRYNTGAAIDVNGARLSALLDDLVAAWPVPITQLAVVGHSMGGLVARSAAWHAAGAGSAALWLPVLDHVVTLGAPHHGAPLARGAATFQRALQALPETRPFARLLDGGRSRGIRDLERDEPVPLVPGAHHTVLAVTVAGNPHGRLADVVGDLLVRPGSACGRPHERVTVHRLGRMHHLDVLNHPRVWPLIRQALTGS